MKSAKDHQLVLSLSHSLDKWSEENLGGEPDWGPLERGVPIEWCGGFMWMARVETDVAPLEVYKHGITRSYLNLDHDGNAYVYTGSGYRRVSLSTVIDRVFDEIEEMGWSRETQYDHEFVAAKYEGLRSAGWTVISMETHGLTTPPRF